MNLTWHIVKKDLRRFRGALALWVVLLAAQFFLNLRLLSPRSADLNWFVTSGFLFDVLLAVTLAIGFFLAAALVLSDPLVGTSMFWVTRPISGGRLLRAKLVTVALLFGVVPVLAWLPWWVYCGYGASDMAGAAVRLLGVQGLAVLAAIVLASLVGETGRFAAVAVLGGVAVLVAVMSFATWDGFQDLSARLVETRLVVATGLLVVTGAVVVWKQYADRRPGSSAAILAAGVGLSLLVVAFWPWRLPCLGLGWGRPSPGGESLSAEIRDFRFSSVNTYGTKETEGVSIRILCKGLPDDSTLAAGTADVRLTWPDGFTIARDDVWMGDESWGYGNFRESPLSVALGIPLHNEGPCRWDPETNAKLEEMVLTRQQQFAEFGMLWQKREFSADQEVMTVRVAVTPEVAARIKAEPPACAITAHLVVQRPEALFELPMRADTQVARNGARLRIVSLMSQARWLYQSKAEPRKEAGRSYSATVICSTAPRIEGVHLYKLDRRHGTVSFLGATRSFSVVPVAATMQALSWDVPSPRIWRTDKWIDVPGWIESATLAAVAYRTVGGLDRELRVDRLQPAPDRPAD